MSTKRLLASFLITLSLVVAGAVLVPQPAAAVANNSTFCGQNIGGFLGFPTWYKYLNPHMGDPDGGGPRPVECIIEFAVPSGIGKVALAIFEIVLRIGGIMAVVFTLYGGFLYLTTTGEPDKAKNARTTILNALVGLFITVSAVAIVNLIGRNLT